MTANNISILFGIEYIVEAVNAGAIISGGQGTAEEKFKAFEDAGIAYTRDPAKIGEKLKEVTGW